MTDDQPSPSADTTADTPVLSIVIPVRNERANLLAMMPIFHSMLPDSYELLVVYDMPEDNTVEAIESLSPNHPELRGVLNECGPGVIGAIQAGVEAARGRYVLVYCIDEFVPLLSVPAMLRLMDDGCEFVSATRYARGGQRYAGSPVGRFISRWGNRAFSWLAGAALSDCTTGVKMFTPDAYNRLELNSRPAGWAVAFEVSIKAQLAGLRLGEVAIVSVDRLVGGTSTFTLSGWLGEYWRWFRWGMARRGAMRRNRDVKRFSYDDVREIYSQHAGKRAETETSP